MRCSTILAAATMVLLSVVSAQTMPDPSAIAACNTCLNNAGIAAAPACKGLENSNVSAPSGTLTDEQKACLCGLIASKDWMNACAGADKCPAELFQQFKQVYDNLAAAPGTCDNVSTSVNGGSRFCGASSVKVAAAGAAAVAIAGALL
ncbi:hypothetical protein EC957_009763 [Mortierella hygrophila]|uniref:Extracellular membrane protein CFEM domain-containing protein n=1 Tax=Mortierella hygrophila TaxID=979708 RepID=A0A9P6FAR0_9FUNG|nr:hypothetical protein EC957_009763 [Mortierella hygrophila]